jgi:putative transposase
MIRLARRSRGDESPRYHTMPLRGSCLCRKLPSKRASYASAAIYGGAAAACFHTSSSESPYNWIEKYQILKGDNMAKNWLFYHFIWSTKNRQSLIDENNQEIIFKSIIAKSIELGATVLAINGVDDHMHLLVSASPTISPSVLIGQVKGVSSHLVRRSGWSDFKWQKEYAIKAVTESQLPIVIRYIQNQQKHHPK